jgi:glycosyltransferase involved in cell wall biosynthesis
MSTEDRQQNQRLKILISLSSWTVGKSGGDVHILEMARSWANNSEIHVLCPDGATSLVREYIPRATVQCFGNFGSAETTLRQSLDYLKRIRSIVKHVRSIGRYDVMIGASHFLPDVIALMFGKCSSRAIYLYHLSTFRHRGISVRSTVAIFAEQISLRVVRLIKPLIFVSNREVQDRLKRWDRVIFTVLGFDVKKFDQIPEQDRTIDVLFVARIIKAKGYLDFVKSIKQLTDLNIALKRVVIIGTGPDVPDLTNKILDNGLQNKIEYLGFVDERKKIQLMKSSKVVLAPSYEEGWGIAIGEALAAGCVPIAYELDVLRELFTEGIQLVPLGNWLQLTEKVHEFLENEELWTGCSEKGKNSVRRYHNEQIADFEYQCLLNHVQSTVEVS